MQSKQYNVLYALFSAFERLINIFLIVFYFTFKAFGSVTSVHLESFRDFMGFDIFGLFLVFFFLFLIKKFFLFIFQNFSSNNIIEFYPFNTNINLFTYTIFRYISSLCFSFFINISMIHE